MENLSESTKSNDANRLLAAVMGSLFISSLNALGTLAWIHLYASGRYTEWWTIVLVIICGNTAIMYGMRLWKQIRGLFL